MIPIYICEDNRSIREFIVEKVNNYCLINDWDMKIALATDNPHVLLDTITKNKQRGIYFLDVDLGDDTMNGFDLGKAIRLTDTRGFITYVTTHDEMLSEVFRFCLEAMDYILKENPEEMLVRIFRCLENVKQRIEQESSEDKPYFTVQVFSKLMHIPIEDIIYLETTSKPHIVCLHTDKQQIEFRGNLNDIVEELNEDFIRCHRSYLVHKEYMLEYDVKQGCILMTNGEYCLVSRNNKKEIKQLLKHI